jgi:hypothetical protein
MNYYQKQLAKAAQAKLHALSQHRQTYLSLADGFLQQATQHIPWQKQFILDPSVRKALFGERRGGKTNAMGLAAIEQGLRVPNCQVLYIGLNQKSCKRTMYDEVLANYLRWYHLPAKLVGNDEMRFDNGSIIYLIGLDATKKEKEKVRGTKASLILIDEMQSYQQSTQVIINDILGPAIADTKAKMIIGGTAGNALGKNYWYEITQHNTKADPIGPSKIHPEWKVYRCSWEANTAIDEETQRPVCDNVREYLQELREAHPGIEQTNGYKQEWNADWIVEKTILMFSQFHAGNLLSSPECTELDTGKHILSPSPQFLQSAIYILGIDYGFIDHTAFVICAYNLKYSNKLYVIESFSQPNMLIPAVAAKMKELDDRYHFSYMVGDSSDLQQFETLKQTYGFPQLQKADRPHKLAHLRTLNGDLQMRAVIFLPGNDNLINELSHAVWDETAFKEGKYTEKEGQPLDNCDAFLYAHTASRHLWYHAPKPKPSEADHFTQSILKAERVRTKQDLLLDDKKRLSPYQHKPTYR